MPRIDVPELEDLVVRLEWVQMSLAGTDEEEGLFAKLDRLYAEGDTPSESGLIPRLESVYRNSEDLLNRLAQFSDLLDSPIADKHAKAIRVAIGESISAGTDDIKEELRDIDKASQLAAERITTSASQAEMALRGTKSDLEDIEERLHGVMPQ